MSTDACWPTLDEARVTVLGMQTKLHQWVLARWYGFGESRMRWKPQVRFGGRTRETHQRKRWQGALVRPYLANRRLDETRRRVQQEIIGHRGRAGDPLYRVRRLLTMAKDRLNEKDNAKLTHFLEAGDPNNEVATAWQAKESLRELYTYRDSTLAKDHPEAIICDFTDKERPPEVKLLLENLAGLA